jgi:chromosome segregation ATPase
MNGLLQGDIEAVATGKGKDRTALFEKISGSDQYEQAYNELKQLKDEAEEQVQMRREVQKGINAEKKQFQVQKKEAEEYMAMLQEQVC